MHTTTCKFCRIFFRNRSRAISILSTRFVVTPPGITADTMFCISSSVYNPGLVPIFKKMEIQHHFLIFYYIISMLIWRVRPYKLKMYRYQISNQNSPFNINNNKNQCCGEREREDKSHIFGFISLSFSPSFIRQATSCRQSSPRPSWISRTVGLPRIPVW